MSSASAYSFYLDGPMAKAPAIGDHDKCTAGPSPTLTWSQESTVASGDEMMQLELPGVAESIESDGEISSSEGEAAVLALASRRPCPDADDSSDEEDGADFVLAVRRWAMRSSI